MNILSRYPSVKEVREYLNLLPPEKDDHELFLVPSTISDIQGSRIFWALADEMHEFSNNTYITLTSPKRAQFLKNEVDKAVKENNDD